MYAIVEIGKRQFKVAQNDELLIEKAVSPRTNKVVLDKVLLLVKDKELRIGEPYLKDARVNCEVLDHVKGPKQIIYRYRRRKSSERKKGHRQKLIRVKVKDLTVK